MPEISEQDFQQLKDQVAALSSQLTAARNRIDDLENFAADHLGLDWGETLVDVNSPHPNMSVNTIESGGGTIRQDVHGMQLKSAVGDTNAITFLDTFTTDDPTTQRPSATLFGNVAAASEFADTHLRSINSYGNAAAGTITAGSGYVQAELDAQYDSAYGSSHVLVLANASTAYVMLQGGLYFYSYITPAQITANQDNYNPTGLNFVSAIRLSSDASRDITGLVPVGSSGQTLLIFNVGSFNIVLKDESASSTAANRFALNGDITLGPDESAMLWYDATSQRWRC